MLMCIAADVLSATTASVFIEDLTWTELQDQIRAGKTLIIVPIGGTEQNGPAMALGKHNVRVKALAERIAQVLGDALVAPVIAYVPEGKLQPPTAHMRLPGTITVPSDAFETLLEYAARSFKLHGFRDVVFIGDHGGYQSSLKTVARRLNREWRATPVRAHAIDAYYRAATVSYPESLKQRGYRESEIGTHAGLADTSLMLAIDARLVRTDRLATGAMLDAEHGVYGNPRRASAKLGEPGTNMIVSETVAAIKKAVARH
jgi:creatinine amidohydrolase